MFHRLSTDTLNWIMIVGVILFIVEIAFFHGGMIFSALFSALLIYIGWKNFFRLWGKCFFWIGVIGLIFSVLNMLAVRFLLIAGIILFIRDYSKSKKESERITPSISGQHESTTEALIQLEPLFDHHAFGDQKTAEHAYYWNDINIHGAFGDRVIDLSNTVLPDDTAVISIRHLVGNIEIYIPYEVEVSVHHSSIFGRAHILGEHHWHLMNQTLSYKTEGYDTTYPRVKIITTLLSGDIEVKRI
ncbi:cell wall-active antibiotics response protein LiaF [Lentibacillus sp. Marseille-P4043]|uniref:cell wall-active antibiotics response protein LiaF n=1 Tax=Lentibacillus sp. Marseille-P4043 TaxID=2040293 RepID=UPI000D0BAFA1|nr:cell wall-active antibiotics response protein LiaF [Lentibacillus sp. Marseille-P4043]